MALYKRISRSFTKNILIREDDHEAVQRFIEEKPDADYYDSIYLYTDAHKEQFDRTKSLAGISDVKTNRIIFDLDSKEDLEKARQDAVLLCSRLISDGIDEESIQLSFTGSKGYHVELFTDQYFTRREVENILTNYAGDLATVDFKITDEQRVIRTPLTKHPKTGLYKTPITLFELEMLNSEDFKQAAAEIVPKHYSLLNNYRVLTPPDRFSLIKNLNAADKQKLEQIELSSDRPDFSRKPKHLTPVKFALSEGYFEPGERHNAFMILASTYRALNFNKLIAYNMLKATNQLQSKRTGQPLFPKEELWNNIIEYVYSPKWRGGTFSEEEDHLIKKLKERLNITENSSIDENPIIISELGGDSFARYARSFYETRIYTGLPDLDEKFPICAGSNVAIVGAASSGKTSICLNILEELNKSDAVSVFASLDMSRSRLYEKLLYKVTNGEISRDELYNAYLEGRGAAFDEMVKERYKNTYIFAKSAPTIPQIREYLMRVQDTTGKPVRLLMIDYFERIGSEKSDDTAASKEVASGIQDLIADFPELTPITLYQPNKMALGGGPDKPILNYANIKGSSFIFQAARQIISLWRPFFSPEYKDMDQFMEMAILKNDLGELDTFKYSWHGKTGTILPMTEEQQELYKEYMDKKIRAEDIKNSGI